MKVKTRRSKLYNFLFLGIIASFVIKGIFYIVFIPPWEAPDEPGHFSYVRYLYIQKSIPEKSTYIYDYAINESFFDQRKNLDNFSNTRSGIEKKELFNRNTYTPNFLAPNIAASPPLYYMYLLPFYSASLSLSSVWSVLLMRVGSLVLSTISVVLVYKILQLIFPKQKSAPLIGMFIMTLQPMFVFVSSVINSDSMVFLFFQLFLLLSIKITIKKEYKSMKYLLFLGLVTGLSSLVKPQLLMLFPIYLYICIVSIKPNYRYYFILLISGVVLPILWYVSKVLTQGLSYFSYAIVNTNNTVMPFWHYPYEFLIQKQPIGIFMSFWGNFGWLDVPMPKWVYVLIVLVIVIPLIKLFVLFCSTPVKSIKLQKGFVLLLTMSFIYTIVIFIYDFMTFFKTQGFAIQGRYLLPVFPAIIILILKGHYEFKTKVRKILLICLIGVLLLVQLQMYFSISTHYYKGYYLLSPILRIYN